ncbi:MAG: DUF2400 domain-containing protein [Bacteroidales bacterium]|nr:DUF2400 domain-containing protein [Bacteroidales bacterium]
MESSVSCDVAALLREYAERYETADFIVGDPSWFMHQVSSDVDREVMAFLAAGLSYGSRAQFLPKIQSLLDSAEEQPDAWVRDGAYRDCFFEGDPACFYRLYTRGDMFCFLELLRALLGRYGSLGGYLREVLVADGALPSRLRAAGLADREMVGFAQEPSAPPSCRTDLVADGALPSRLRAAGLADREMVGFAQEPLAPPSGRTDSAADGALPSRLLAAGLADRDMVGFAQEPSAPPSCRTDSAADGALPQGRKASALAAVEALCRHFGTSAVVPKDASSACKRLCMFLRWMVRDSSPVDLGLWTDFIDKRSLIVPLDTHVLTEASALGLIHSRNASMSSALRLTSTLATIFPDDPLKGDFALFGYGVNH